VRSAELNTFDHLHVHCVALGNKDDCLELCISYGNSGCASLIRRDNKGTAKAVPVKESGPCFDGLGLEAIRLIKIDVEGFEDSIFSGAASYLCKNSPDAMVFESHDYSIDFADQSVTKTLSSLGYSFIEIQKKASHVCICAGSI
jgi:FkbM family methyltransferase